MTDAHVGPPPGWNAEEAAERLRVKAHALSEHKNWLQETNEHGRLIHFCPYCEQHG